MIRSARPHEAPALSALALRSKGHWGYDEEFLEACRAELTVETADIERHVVRVLQDVDGAVAGFYALYPAAHTAREACAELGLFYLEPRATGRGLGRLLWRDMIAVARRCGYRRVAIDSDPHAEGFYVAMGARRVGTVPSGSIAGRRLPRLLADIDDESDSRASAAEPVS